MKVLFVSKVTPVGHLSTFLMQGIGNKIDIDYLVDDRASREQFPPEWNVSMTLKRGYSFVFTILRSAIKSKADIVHLQHEINMYGGVGSAICFPLLVLTLRLLRFRVVTTIHSAVPQDQIDSSFGRLFFFPCPAIFLRFFFKVLYLTLNVVSHRVICHTKLTRDILVRDYFASKKKIVVIPFAIPKRPARSGDLIARDNFLYYGYITRRKGLDMLLRGYRKYLDGRQGGFAYRLVMAGGTIEGQESALDEIRNLIRHLDLEEVVELVGFIDNEQQQDALYHRCYSVVMPALISMGSSGPLVHATSYGRTVLASAVGHQIEDIITGRNGFLVGNENWAEAFDLAHENPDLIRRMEKFVLARAEERSASNQADKTIELYRGLLS